MARLKYHNTVRLLLKLLLFTAIIQQNYGNPAPTVTPLPPQLPFEMELSSPVPFSTRKPEISSKTDFDAVEADTTRSSSSSSSSTSTTSKTIDTNLKDLNVETLNNNNHNNDNNDNNSDYDDYLETDLKIEKTTPTSMEQQDDPVIPPTTITFSNVAAAGILGNSNSNIDGVVNGGGSNSGTNSFNDDPPPYDAVDEKYGKVLLSD